MSAVTNATHSLLVLYYMGQPLYSSRGLTQTYQPIAAANNVSRSINGNAMDLSYEQFHLYSSEITCTDFDSPSLDGVWPGMFISVDCTFELSYITALGSPQRNAVAESSVARGDFTHYRPHMEFVVVDFSVGHDEYQDSYNWRLSLEEAGFLFDT